MNINLKDNSDITNELYKAIKQCYTNTITMSPTSSAKIAPLHYWMAKTLEDVLGEGYFAYASGYRELNGRKEVRIKGKYFKKNVDVAVYYEGKPVAIVELKFHRNNLSQNSNNNIENMMGYTANVRGNDMIFSNFIVMREETPYLKKSGALERMESLGTTQIDKYSNLLSEPLSVLHRPDYLVLCIVETGNEHIYKQNIGKLPYKDPTLSLELIDGLCPSVSNINGYLPDDKIVNINNFFENLCTSIKIKTKKIF